MKSLDLFQALIVHSKFVADEHQSSHQGSTSEMLRFAITPGLAIL